MLEITSPAKAILFGEHAVVYVKGAIALSLDLRMRLTIVEGQETTVNGQSLGVPKHRYIRTALDRHWDGAPLTLQTRSEIPAASGLGSSAALSCCISAGLLRMKGNYTEEELARQAFDVEYETQGRASPTDTSCSTHGKGILVTFLKGEDHLWSIGRGDIQWHVHHLEPPDLTLVVGFTKIPSLTPAQVQKVRNYYDRSGFAREIIDEIGGIVQEGAIALKGKDLVRIGELMDRNHACLSILGVSTRELQKLKDASDPYSYGVKLTGAGGGGSIVALTDEPKKVKEAIEGKGGKAYIAPVSRSGTTVSEYPS